MTLQMHKHINKTIQKCTYLKHMKSHTLMHALTHIITRPILETSQPQPVRSGVRGILQVLDASPLQVALMQLQDNL